MFFCVYVMKLVFDETCMQPGNAAVPRHVILRASAGYWGTGAEVNAKVVWETVTFV